MSIFDDIIGKDADDRLAEEMLYAEAMREIESGIRRDGLWGKAIAESDGDEKKAKAFYLKLRVQALKDELKVARQNFRKEDSRHDVYEKGENSGSNQNIGTILFTAVWKKILFSIGIVLLVLLIADAWLIFS